MTSADIRKWGRCSTAVNNKQLKLTDFSIQYNVKGKFVIKHEWNYSVKLFEDVMETYIANR